jgi:hypothetical protein
MVFMNERIRELALQAGFTDFVLTDLGMDQEVEKFAELIVKECAGIVDVRWDPVLVEKIKQHFGVEE